LGKTLGQQVGDRYHHVFFVVCGRAFLLEGGGKIIITGDSGVLLFGPGHSFARLEATSHWNLKTNDVPQNISPSHSFAIQQKKQFIYLFLSGFRILVVSNTTTIEV